MRKHAPAARVQRFEFDGGYVRLRRRKARAKKNIKAARMTDRLTTATLRVRRLIAKTKSVCVGLSLGDRTASKIIPKIRTRKPSALTAANFMIPCRHMINVQEREPSRYPALRQQVVRLRLSILFGLRENVSTTVGKCVTLPSFLFGNIKYDIFHLNYQPVLRQIN